MNKLENRALEMLLTGDDQLLYLLRAQGGAATVACRDLTGVGFLTHLSVPASAPRGTSCARLVLGDGYAEVEGLERAAGFLLFVTDGVVDGLECFIFDDRWPDAAKLRSFGGRITYIRQSRAVATWSIQKRVTWSGRWGMPSKKPLQRTVRR